MGYKYLDALSQDFIINRKKGFVLILVVSGVPIIAWLLQFGIASYVLVMNIWNFSCPYSARQAQAAASILHEISIEILAIFILFFINYMATGLRPKTLE